MITAIANRIADFICSNSDLSDDERDVYVYGYEIAISSIITFSLLIITGLLVSRLIEAIVFFAVFYLLRRRTGGYHADTYLKCNLIFELNVLSVLLICCLDIPIIAHIAVNLATFISCLIITAIKAPISNPNKPISEDMKSNHKKWALALIITFELISVLSFNWQSISICISLAMASTAIARQIAIFKKGRTQLAPIGPNGRAVSTHAFHEFRKYRIAMTTAQLGCFSNTKLPLWNHGILRRK